VHALERLQRVLHIGRGCAQAPARRCSTSLHVRIAFSRLTPSTSTWELPAIGAVTAPAAVLIRPDGYVAWVGHRPQLVADALAGAGRAVLWSFRKAVTSERLNPRGCINSIDSL